MRKKIGPRILPVLAGGTRINGYRFKTPAVLSLTFHIYEKRTRVGYSDYMAEGTGSMLCWITLTKPLHSWHKVELRMSRDTCPVIICLNR